MAGHTLPELPFAYDALEPHIDAPTMENHHSRHHRAHPSILPEPPTGRAPGVRGQMTR